MFRIKLSGSSKAVRLWTSLNQIVGFIKDRRLNIYSLDVPGHTYSNSDSLVIVLRVLVCYSALVDVNGRLMDVDQHLIDWTISVISLFSGLYVAERSLWPPAVLWWTQYVAS